MSSDKQNPQCFQKTLVVRDFRNLSHVSLDFGEGHNLFIGPNGHGKTNCLEAIALACSLRPMQTLQNGELIRFQTSQAKILASFGGAYTLDVEIDIFSQGKKAKLNQHPLRASSQLARFCPLVSFVPHELSLISGSQSLRRRALDQAAWSLFAEYALVQRAYEKILKNRNRLLKDGPHDRDTFAIFTNLLIEEGAKLMHFRLQTLAHMQDIFAVMVKSILGPGQKARILYSSHEQSMSDHALSDLSAWLTHKKHEQASMEQRRRVTMFGPHLDDVIFLINGVDAKSYASRGYTRALVFSFKLAQMMAIFRLRGFAPIIILDDIVSELDNALKANLIATVAELKTQVFFSTTDKETFGSKLPIDRVFSVNDGEVTSV